MVEKKKKKRVAGDVEIVFVSEPSATTTKTQYSLDHQR